MSYEEFRDSILTNVEGCPPSWRYGQSVFNIVDALYGVARAVQFNKGVDCFYDDKQVDNFISKAYEVYKECL